MEQMTVGKVAKAVGVSPKTIRLWEARGLLTPVERTPSGYRQFTAADLERLRFIHRAKVFGLTLEEIRKILELRHGGEPPCDQVKSFLALRLAQIDLAIAELQELRHTLITFQAVRPSEQSGPKYSICPIIEHVPLSNT